MPFPFSPQEDAFIMKGKRALRIIVAATLMLTLLLGTVTTAFAAVVPDTLKTGSPFTNKTYTHHASHKGDTIVQAIDISQWNVVQDWNAVKNSGVEYVFVRVGLRGQGSGALDYDNNYKKNIEGALNAGLQVGVYIFSQAITQAEAREEARYLIERVQGYNITLPLVMDYEYGTASNGSCRLKRANLSRRAATDVVLAFCDEVSDAGYKPMLYANKSMLSSDLYASEIEQVAKIWLAHFTTSSSYSGAYYGWQYTENGAVPGVRYDSRYNDVLVDCNFFYVPTSTAEPSTPEVPEIDEDLLNDLASITYLVDGYEESTTYGEIRDQIEPQLAAGDLLVGFADLEGNLLEDDDPIKTNDIAVIFDAEGNIYEIDVMVLRGDVNSDGEIDIFDPMDMYLYFNGDLTLEGGQIEACDFNKDGEADIFDPMDIYLYLNR